MKYFSLGLLLWTSLALGFPVYVPPNIQRYALILGGGDTTPGTNTIFDQSLIDYGQSLSSAGYQISVSFDGGHTDSTAIAKSFDANATDFTAENAQSQVNAMVSKIQSMKKGDQVMVVIDTHGVSPDQQPPGDIHDVETTTSDFDLKQLESIQAAAQKQGVKLAILDNSCYSGNSITLAKKYPNTCVITSAPKDSVGYTDFGSNLTASFQSGSSLEDSFLNERRKDSLNYSNISTCQGQVASQAIENLDSIIKNLENNTTPVVCAQNNTDIQDQAKHFADIYAQVTTLSSDDFKKITQAFINYNNVRLSMVGRQNYVNNHFVQVGLFKFSYTTLEDIDDTISADKSMLAATTNPEIKASIESFLKVNDEMKVKQQELLQNDPIFKHYDSEANLCRKRDTTCPLIQAAEPIWNFEHQAYDKIYRNAEQSCAQKDDPCRNFKF